MKTAELYKKLSRENIRLPSDWVICQDGAGNFLGFMHPKKYRNTKIDALTKISRSIVSDLERYFIERSARKKRNRL